MKHNSTEESKVSFQTPKTSVASTSGGVPPAPPPPPPPPVQQETAPTGITAAALQAVKLNKVSSSDHSRSFNECFIAIQTEI